jgi:hypothetical protein
MGSDFKQLAQQCGSIVRRVLSGEIRTRNELEALWPNEAEVFDVLDLVRDDIFEYWVMPPQSYAGVLETEAEILEAASHDPIETRSRLEQALDSSG